MKHSIMFAYIIPDQLDYLQLCKQGVKWALRRDRM